MLLYGLGLEEGTGSEKPHTFCTYQIWEFTGFIQSSVAIGKPVLLITMHEGDEPAETAER